MNVAFISSEAVPFAKTGGLADVAGSLPNELVNLGCNVKLFLPKYDLLKLDNIDIKKADFNIPIRIAVGKKEYLVEVFSAVIKESNIEVFFIGQEQLFNRGTLYTTDSDEDIRFIVFQRAVIETIQRLQWAPDIIHCNDWQTGLIPLYIKYNYSWDKLFKKTATVFTIHNIGYQGLFPASTAFKAEIPQELFYPMAATEFYGKVSFLKAGIYLSDVINTVSETYAQELLTPELGGGMEGVLKERLEDFSGIVNGVDYNIWSPEKDKIIPHKFTSANLSGKEKNKKYLLKEVKMPYKKNTPLIGMVSRIVSQKGFDILARAVKYLVQLDAQWIILGTGEKKYENKLLRVAKLYPNNLKVNLYYNNELAHIIEAGADIFLMPSLYEPCGLNQIYSLKYGTIPVVRKTGGLADTVKDWDVNIDKKSGDGFVFDNYNGHDLYATVKRAVQCYGNKDIWKKIQKNAMNKDYSWRNSAEEYLKLYKKALVNKTI